MNLRKKFLMNSLKIYKYGELIGKAMSPIGKGCLVDHKNIYSVPRDYESEYVPEA